METLGWSKGAITNPICVPDSVLGEQIIPYSETRGAEFGGGACLCDLYFSITETKMSIKHRWIGLLQVLPGLEVFPDIYLMVLILVHPNHSVDGPKSRRLTEIGKDDMDLMGCVMMRLIRQD